MVFYRNAYSRGGNIIEDVPAFSLSKKSGWSWAFLIDMVEWAKG